MASFFDNFLKKTKQIVNETGKKTGELVEKGKLKKNILDLERDISKLYSETGMKLFSTENESEILSLVSNMKAKIVSMKEQIAELNRQIAELPDTIVCPKCGFRNVPGSEVCEKCSASLLPEPEPEAPVAAATEAVPEENTAVQATEPVSEELNEVTEEIKEDLAESQPSDDSTEEPKQ